MIYSVAGFRLILFDHSIPPCNLVLETSLSPPHIATQHTMSNLHKHYVQDEAHREEMLICVHQINPGAYLKPQGPNVYSRDVIQDGKEVKGHMVVSQTFYVTHHQPALK